MQIRRLCFFAGCILTAFGGLAYRLVDLQLLRHEQLSEEARNNTERTIVRPPRRGDIRDNRGNLLAASKTVHNVCADPYTIGTNYWNFAIQLAPVLGMPLDEVAEKIRPKMRTNSLGEAVPMRWVRLKKKLELEEWDKVKEAVQQVSFGVDETKLKTTKQRELNRIRSRAVFDEPQELRFYPNESLAAHLLGYVGISEKTNEAGRIEEVTTGKDGLELMLNNVLTGIHGWRQTETDSGQRELVLFREQDVEPRPGLNAILTIDAGIQHIVEDELAKAFEKEGPASICSIVVRPKTGEILAMAVLPNYNPNAPGDAPADARRNRAVTDFAEPGSTFKVVTISGAMNEHLVDLDTLINCENGKFFYGGKWLKDAHPVPIVPVERVISKSSNIGAAKIGIQMGKDKLYEYIRAFGFGQRTGIVLPAEAAGMLKPPARWSGISITRIPMGHEVACTPLQMVMAMSAIANGGVLMRPMLVSGFVDEQGRAVTKYEPQPVRRAITPETAAKMVTALKSVISTNGTGMKAKLAYYTAAGKTGTAQKWIDGRYSNTRHYSSFVGFFPADNPELCISVVVDDPQKGLYGGEAAGPVFQHIAERAANYLAIPPEFLPNQTLSANYSGGPH